MVNMKNNFKRSEIDIANYFSEIFKGIKEGCLLTTKNEQKINSMTISWGQVGIEWNKPIFTVYVRRSRFTHKMLSASPEFTINIAQDEHAKKILAFCGSKSGASIDKIAALNLTPVKGMNIDAPGLLELPLTLECKVIYQQQQDENCISEELKNQFYPTDKASDFQGSKRDFHTMFCGEIVAAYIIER